MIRVSSPAIPSAEAIYWTLLQAAAWVLHGSDDAVQITTARHSERTGPGAAFEDDEIDALDQAAESLLERMRAGELRGYGRANGGGDTVEIPSAALVDMEVELPDTIRPPTRRGMLPGGVAFAVSVTPPTPPTQWHDVRLKRADVKRLWTGLSRTAVRQEPSQGEVDRWYRERVQSWPADKPPPSRDDCTAAAKAQFGPAVTRAMVRDARGRIAPKAWSTTGNKGHKRAAAALAERSGQT